MFNLRFKNFYILFIDFFSIHTYNINVRTFYSVRHENTVYSSTFRNVRQRNIAYVTTLHNVRQRNIVYQPPGRAGGFLLQKRGVQMKERGLYYATPELAQMIQSAGGIWNDTKHRPIVCLVKSSEHSDIYWAIPMGKLNHRNPAQRQRLNFYMNLPDRDIRSCYYHIGRTSSQSIFFISDTIPITEKYIAEIHVGKDQKHYIIKNKKLIAELERKLFRILSLENSSKNHFRQHITDVKNFLLSELQSGNN